MDPFDAPGNWLRCALHAHTTNSDGELAPEFLVRHYEWAGYDVLAIDRSLGADGRAVDQAAARHPLDRAERARRPTRRTTRTCSPSASRPIPSLPEGSSRRCPTSSTGSRRTAACRSSRTPTGAACAPSSGGTARACSGSRCGTPAASSSSAAATRRSTGTRRSSTDGAVGRSRPTTRTTPATTAASPGPGCAQPRSRRRRCSTRSAAGAFYGSTGPEIRAVEVDEHEVVVDCSPAAAVTLYCGPLARRARERRPARLSEQRPRPRDERRRPDHARRRSQRPVGRRPLRPRRGQGRERDEGLDEPAVDRVDAIEQLARAPLRPADRRRRHRRRGHRRGGDGERPLGRARRQGRLRLGQPLRRPRSSSTAACATSRWATSASCAKRTRNAGC